MLLSYNCQISVNTGDQLPIKNDQISCAVFPTLSDIKVPEIYQLVQNQ